MEDGFSIVDSGKHKGEIKKATAGIKMRIKSLFNLMLDYAVEYEITDRITREHLNFLMISFLFSVTADGALRNWA